MNEQYTRAPHRRSTGSVGTSPNAALMIDFDNVTMAIRSNLGQELRNFLESDIVRGKVSVQRAYADWRRYPQYIVPLSEASIDLIFAPAYGSSKKNATDIRLAIDALELVFTRPEIGTYILLSGDSDFSSLVLKLKEYGKYVIGVGLQESTSDLLVQNCDEYYSYTSLSGLTSAAEMETDKHDPWELVEVAVKKMAGRDDVMRSDRLKQVMLEIDQGFDEKDYGFSKFNRFLAEASSRGLLNLRKIENGQYEVGPTDGSGSGASSRGRESGGDGRSRRGGRGGRGRGRSGGRESRESRPEPSAPSGTAPEPPAPIEAASLRDAYRLLRDVTSGLSEDGEAVRDSEIKRAMLQRDEQFDEAALGFSKFSRFLRQAYDEGVVDLITDEDGNYHVRVPEEGEEPGDGGGRAPSGGGPAEADRGGRRSGEHGHRDRGERPKARESREAREPTAREPAAQEPAAPEAESPEAPSGTEKGSRTARDAAASMAESRRDTADAGAESRGAGTEESRGDAAAAEETEERTPSRRRSGLGRFRRGSRGAGGPEPSAGGSGLPGPVDADGGDAPAEEASGAGENASVEPERGDGGRGLREPGSRDRSVGLGRRRGRRGSEDPAHEEAPGASGPAEKGEPAGGGSGGEAVAAEATGADDVVEHMVKSYAGVGRKTAEALVDAFGEGVFSVIDEQPDRLANVLPEHRAQAVIEAREAELEASPAEEV